MLVIKRCYKVKTTFINTLFIETRLILNQLIDINSYNLVFILLINQNIYLLYYSRISIKNRINK